MSRLQRAIILISLLLSLIALSGCGSGGEGEVANGIIPELFVFPGESELRLISEEPILQDNCDGSAETSQTVERQHTILYSLELGTGIQVSADGRAKIPEIGEVGVGVEVATNYKVGYGREEAIGRSVTVAAKEGTNIQHTIRQYEVWETGEILIVAGEINKRMPYSFRRDFSIEALSPANIGCPGSSFGGDASEPSQDPQSATPTSAAAVNPEPPTISCIAKEQGPLAQTDHFFSGPVHVVQLWRQNGQSPWGSNEVMAVVIGDVNIVATGGNVWTYPSAECETIARVHMQDGANIRGSTVVTELDLRDASLIK